MALSEREDEYAAALLEAVVRDLAEHPVPGAIARLVVRWFEHSDPHYLTVHALGTGEEAELGDGDAWYPLEWPDVDRELERTSRALGDPRVVAASSRSTRPAPSSRRCAGATSCPTSEHR